MPHRLAVCIVGLIVLAGMACDKSHNPLATGAESQLSLYTASLGLANSQTAAQGDSQARANCQSLGLRCTDDFVYVDTYDTARTDYPFFSPGVSGTYNYLGFAYPEDYAEQLATPQFERVEYFREPAGAHRFRFADSRASIVANSSFALAAGASTVLYLTDSLLAYYRVLAIDETTPGPSNAVRLRVLNLSPDVGVLSAFVLDNTGQYVWSNLPQHVAFDAVTPYIALDSTLAASDGNVYVKFFAGVDTAATLLTVVVPYMRGRSYHLVVEGNARTDTLHYGATQVVINPSDTLRFGATQVVIGPSLTARVRATF